MATQTNSYNTQKAQGNFFQRDGEAKEQWDWYSKTTLKNQNSTDMPFTMERKKKYNEKEFLRRVLDIRQGKDFAVS